jgi:hypothetical protein
VLNPVPSPFSGLCVLGFLPFSIGLEGLAQSRKDETVCVRDKSLIEAAALKIGKYDRPTFPKRNVRKIEVVRGFYRYPGFAVR